MKIDTCPICGRSLAPMEAVLADSMTGYQCHNCWSRISTMATVARGAESARRKPTATRKAVRPQGKKS